MGNQKYFVKKNNNKISSLLISQIYKNKAMIVDLVGEDFNENILMIKIFINYCKEHKIINVKFATSNSQLIKKIDKFFNYEYSNFESFIYIKNLVNQNILKKEVLDKAETYETYVSGDVLIR